MRVLVAVVVAVGILAGCISPEASDCAAPDASLLTPWVDGGYLRTDPDQAWDTVTLLQGGETSATAGPGGWTVDSERLSPPGEANFSLLSVRPGSDKGHLAVDYRLSDCGSPRAGTISWELAHPEMGKSAEPGQGVHVYTAGFWENGTLFYTNIAAIDQDDWPRAGWYAWEGDMPLPVYVYDQDRSEQPAAWKAPSSHVPASGTPADPIIKDAAYEADAVSGLGYFTTIPGFNEALKGLSTNTVRVVRMTPEEGYTREGNEEHPLYGASLVFYIKVVDVVDAPCPLETGKLCGLTTPQR